MELAAQLPEATDVTVRVDSETHQIEVVDPQIVAVQKIGNLHPKRGMVLAEDEVFLVAQVDVPATLVALVVSLAGGG